MSHKSRPISTFIKNSQSKTTMKEIKKEDDEVSIKSSRKSSRNGKQGRRHKSKRTSRKPTFEGRTEELKGHIFDCSDARQANSYTNTIKEIAQYMGTKYKYGGDIRYLVENLKAPKISVPDSPEDNATLSEKEIWKLKISEHVKRKTQLRENSKNLYSLI